VDLDAAEDHQAVAMVLIIVAVIIHPTAVTVLTIAAVENKIITLNKMLNLFWFVFFKIQAQNTIKVDFNIREIMLFIFYFTNIK